MHTNPVVSGLFGTQLVKYRETSGYTVLDGFMGSGSFQKESVLASDGLECFKRTSWPGISTSDSPTAIHGEEAEISWIPVTETKSDL